jgi:hypothetical protein
VIVDSEVPALSRKKTQFLISSAEVGIFDIVAKIAGISVEKVPTVFFRQLIRFAKLAPDSDRSVANR